uniref:Uncharacterized protein n=1 Tax=viral metagenome TaxID=1070528 RepID=A0A6C0HVS2_9ZZZZ
MEPTVPVKPPSIGTYGSSKTSLYWNLRFQ